MNGRPRLPISDALFAVNYKIYSTISARRFMTDLREAKESGYITRTPHYNSIFNYLEHPGLTPILHKLIVQTSLPVASLETNFAADSSGFTAASYCRWHDHKYGKIQKQDWVKVHLMTGVRTNIVTSVVIKDRFAADAPQLPSLTRETAENFKINEVSADKAYGSFENYNVIEQCGGMPFIMFKDNHTAKGFQLSTGRGSNLWTKMYHYFQFNQDEYLKHYHKRSNVETTFSMIKAKFGGYVRSKTEVAMVNECLCKIICHNICVLIQEMHELGIDVDFGKISQINQQITCAF